MARDLVADFVIIGCMCLYIAACVIFAAVVHRREARELAANDEVARVRARRLEQAA